MTSLPFHPCLHKGFKIFKLLSSSQSVVDCQDKILSISNSLRMGPDGAMREEKASTQILLPDLGHLFLQWQSVSAGTVLSEQEWLPGQWVPCQVQEGETVLFPHKWFPPPPAPTRAGRGVSVAIKFPRPCFFPFCPPCNSSSAVVGLLSHVQLF